MRFDVIYTERRDNVYPPLETLLQGIAPVVARRSALGDRKFTIYQLMVSNPQRAIGKLIDGRIDSPTP